MGWQHHGQIVADDQLVHSGKYSTRIDRTASSTPSFSTIAQSIPVDFSGKTIFWRGWIKIQNVGDYVALWANQVDANGNTVQFVSMQELGYAALRTGSFIPFPCPGTSRRRLSALAFSSPAQAPRGWTISN